MTIIEIVESLYLIYIIIFFKTKWSIHHPLEGYLLDDKPSWMQHPISSGRYENKICLLGHWTAILLVIWIVIRNRIEGYQKINGWIWGIVVMIGMCLNLNFVIYLLPVVILDLYWNKKGWF
jgi:hypothetical protein